MQPKGVVFDGKTLDEAVRKGMEALGLSRAEVMITVLEPSRTPSTVPRVLPNGSLGAGMIVSSIVPLTFLQSLATADVTIPQAARHRIEAAFENFFIDLLL